MSHESTPAGGCSADGTNPTPAAEQAKIAAALKLNMSCDLFGKTHGKSTTFHKVTRHYKLPFHPHSIEYNTRTGIGRGARSAPGVRRPGLAAAVESAADSTVVALNRAVVQVRWWVGMDGAWL
jgi:hypothetical protein